MSDDTVNLTVRIPKEMLKRIDDYVDRTSRRSPQITRMAAIRFLIDFGLAHLPDGEIG